MQILYILLALILLPLALVLLLLGLLWAANGIIYLITFAIACVLLGLIKLRKDMKKDDYFIIHFIIIAGILALLPTIVLCINMSSQEIILPYNIASWSCGFHALNWFSFISGNIYAINTCLVLFLSEIINKYFVSLSKKLKWGLAYITTISQITIAGFVIKSAIEQDNFSNNHLYLATIPILEISILLVVLIGIYRIIKSKISTNTLYLKGDNSYKNGQYDEALKYYNQAYDIDTSNTDYYHYAVGMVYYAQKKYAITISYLNSALPIIKNNNKKIYLDLIEKIQKELCKEVNRLYDESLSCKKSKNYIQALNYINEAIKIAQEAKLSTDELFKYKSELNKYVNNISKAENDFQIALQKYNDKDYKQAIENLEYITSIVPDNETYKSKLEEIKNQYQSDLPKAENFYNQAKKYYENNNLEKAILEINSALNLINDRNYIQLKKDIEDKQEKVKKEQKAEKLYIEAKNLYIADSTAFNKIIDYLNKAITLSPQKTYLDMLTKVKKESDLITAEKLYEEAKEYFNNKDYGKGLSSIKKAVQLDPSNRVYLDLKQKIDWEQKETKKRNDAEEYFKYGLEALRNGNFPEAVAHFRGVLKIQPNNKESKTLLAKAQKGKIDITECTKKALLSLDFINKEQAENIIRARNNGEMWYDYQKFAEQFGIMPHLWVDVEAKIEFPLKQANKYGRRLDW